MRLLHDRDGRTPGPLTLDDLVDLYRWPDSGGAASVRSNFISTLDGSIQGLDGHSGSINTASDHQIFALHRALADVIVVGAGTVRSEGYRAVDLQPWQRSLRAGLGLAPYPALAVITRSLSLDPAFADPAHEHGPAIVVTVPGHRGDTLAAFRRAGAEVVLAPDPIDPGGMGPGRVDSGRGDPGSIDLAWVLDRLAERGQTRVLCEGGPTVHRDLLAAGLLDELSLTLAPNAVGGLGHRSTAGAPLPERADFDLRFVLLGEDQTVFTNYRRR